MALEIVLGLTVVVAGGFAAFQLIRGAMGAWRLMIFMPMTLAVGIIGVLLIVHALKELLPERTPESRQG